MSEEKNKNPFADKELKLKSQDDQETQELATTADEKQEPGKAPKKAEKVNRLTRNERLKRSTWKRDVGDRQEAAKKIFEEYCEMLVKDLPELEKRIEKRKKVLLKKLKLDETLSGIYDWSREYAQEVTGDKDEAAKLAGNILKQIFKPEIEQEIIEGLKITRKRAVRLLKAIKSSTPKEDFIDTVKRSEIMSDSSDLEAMLENENFDQLFEWMEHGL